ncbi:MAG TPA: hypothetical protein PLR65_13680, partial [Anaerolineales bacterium]|nr:hypothetical protein [Anaerolineales bacterium]
ALNALAFFSGLVLLAAMLAILRHRARASLIAGLFLAPLYWLLNLRGAEFWIAIVCGLVIAYRFLMDWNRQYRGL